MPIDRAALRAGLAALALLATLALGLPDRVASLRESVLDLGLAATAPPPSGEVIVVAIDAQALDQFGRWPWPRARLARVLGQIAAAKPAVIGLDLVLSGHTHGGQVVLPGLGAIAARRFPVVAGPATEGNCTLFVSRGVGTVVAPVRINCPPEVTVLTLRSSASI